MGVSGRLEISEHQRLTGIIAAQQEIVAVELDVDAMLGIVAERVMALTGAGGAAVQMVDGAAIVFRAATGFLAGHVGKPVTAASLASVAVRTGETLLCEDTELDPRVDRDTSRRTGARSLVVVPLIHDGANVGVLSVVSATCNAFDNRDVETLQVMGGLVSVVMSRAAAIEEREVKFRAFMDNSPMAAFLKDHDGRFVFVNAAHERLVGRAAEALLGKTAFDVFPAAMASHLTSGEQQVLSLGRPLESVDSLVVDGATRTVLSVKFPVADARRRVAIGGLGLDVSERVAAEEALRASEHRFRSLAEYASDSVISLDRDGKIAFWNHTAVRVFGYEPDEAMGLPLAAILSVVEGATAHGPLEQFAVLAASRQSRPAEFRGRRRNGSDFPVEVSVSTWMSGEDQYFTGILRDVSERKLIEEQLSHATRLISIGTLASGIGHEINNPLSYVMYNLEFAGETIDAMLAEAARGNGLDTESLQKLAPLRDDLIEAYNGADRIRAILRDLRTFSRAGDERKLPTSVSRAADAAINMVFNQIRHHARIVKDYQDTALVDAVEGKLVQVVVNLLVNAAQATVQGRPEENVIGVRTGMVDERWVMLEVSDTGTGIRATDLSRIFDPFYTTKGVGSGTGLGLSISHGIVQSFGGTIEVQSEPGQGSTFRVKLPVTRASDQRASQRPRTSIAAAARRGRVMVIDDDPQVSASLQRMLAREHDVVAHISSRAAVGELAGGPAYDLILCDLMMPELPGWELYEKLTDAQKKKVAFMTGGAFQPNARDFLAGIKNPVLDKPIDARQLRALLRDRLAT